MVSKKIAPKKAASKKVLIVGGSSFIGRNLLETAPKEWEITATYYKNSSFAQFCERFPNAKAQMLDVVSGEIAKGEYDVIIYIAANSDPKKSFVEPLYDLQVNAGGVIRVLEKIKCRKFIYFSSGAVYLKDKFPYLISKMAGEEYVKWHAGKKGFGYVIVRLFEAFGPYSPERKIFRKICGALERGEKSFTIYGDGKNFVDPMYVEDTARGIIAIANCEKENLTVDLCTGNPMTITQVAEAIARIYKVNLQLEYNGQAVENVFFKGNPKQMKENFGFEPKISFEEGIIKWKKRKLE